MSLTRALDDAMVSMWKTGRGVGGTFSQRGHEAIGVGVGMALEPDDVVAPMHRDLGTYLVRGMRPERVFGNLLGRSTGPSRGRDANLHGLGDLSLGIIGFISHLPQSLPVTLGAAMAFRYRAEPRVALTFVGDGGSSAGAFHETMNMAALWQAPMVIVVENNQYAYSTPLDQELARPDIVAQADSYGMPGSRIEGNDVELVYETTREAVEWARRGGGPTLIEMVTMRMLGHAIHDGAEYVPQDLLAEWERKDPVASFRNRLIGTDGSVALELDDIDRQVSDEVREAISAAEAAPLPDPSTLEQGVWA